MPMDTYLEPTYQLRCLSCQRSGPKGSNKSQAVQAAKLCGWNVSNIDLSRCPDCFEADLSPEDRFELTSPAPNEEI